jgi:ketosteroid isomerase-like protein
MSEENVAVVRSSVEHFLEAGAPDWSSMNPELIQVQDHDILDGRDYRGVAGVVQWLRDWGEPWSKWSLEPEEYIDAGDRVIVVARMHATGRGSGAEIDRQDALLYQVIDGKIVRIDYFNNKPEALEAAGLG